MLKVLLCTTKYYSVLQSSIPVLLCTTLYYKVLLQYYSVLQTYYSSTTPLLQSATPVLVQYRKSFQNDRFVRGILQISQEKLPKRAFRAKLPTNFTEGGSKMIVSCEASSKFHKRRFQNERFARGFLQISQNKLPKRAFCAMLPTISQKKLPKGSFRAMLPTIFTEKTSKRTESLKWKKIQKKKWKKFTEKFWTLVYISRDTSFLCLMIEVFVLPLYRTQPWVGRLRKTKNSQSTCTNLGISLSNFLLVTEMYLHPCLFFFNSNVSPWYFC